MDKKLLYLFLIICLVALCACKGADNKNSSENNKAVELTYTESSNENPSACENKNAYFAKEKDDLNIIYDYDTICDICNDACQEFARAVMTDDKADFTPYIDNNNLQMYMHYRVENHIFDYNDDTVYKLMITEVKFNDNYVLVSGITGAIEEADGYSLQGVNHFLINNVNGRLYIADWYWDNMDSLDVLLRGEFSAENNLTYWTELKKYEPVLQKLKN